MRTLHGIVTRAAYPLNEAATLLGGLSRSALYKMNERGELRFVKLGRRTLIPADEIRRLVAESPNSDHPEHS